MADEKHNHETLNGEALISIAPAKDTPATKLDLSDVREKMAGRNGRRYWQSLEELSQEPGFDAMMQREFPRQASEWLDPVSRRGFLKLMSASLALAGLSACTKQPEESIVPYVQQPEELIPGKPIYYASVRPTAFGAQPILVETQMFRPTKVEGNPDHVFGKGSADAYTQASILDLYDPDRLQSVTKVGNTHTWSDFNGEMRDAALGDKSSGGAGMRFLTETVISPTVADQFKNVLKSYPQAKWYQYEPVNRDSARAASRQVFGQYVDAQYQLENADVIVSLDADFLSGGTFPGFLKLASDYAKKRKLEDEKSGMSRMYVVESQMTTTGGKADHRLPLTAAHVEMFASALASAVGAGGGGSLNDSTANAFLKTVAADLQANRGKCVVIPGEQQSPAVHALAAAMNSALGNVGKTVVYTDTVEIVPTEQVAGLKELVADMNAGKVKLLVVIGGNPVYDAPADLKFLDAYEKVPLRAHITSNVNETSRHSHWNAPLAHYMECWSDARSYDGTVSIQQPTIEPLYGGKGYFELLAVFTEATGTTAYDGVRAYWQAQKKGADFEPFWKKALHDGFIAGTAFTPKTVTAKSAPATTLQGNSAMEVVFRPDPTIYDGRFNNNGWLQELPKQVTKLTWDNAAMVSPKTAADNKLQNQYVANINVNGVEIKAPVKVVPGHPDNSITLTLGYGRDFTGRVGTGTGYNAYVARTSTNPHVAFASSVQFVDEKIRLAVTQYQYPIESGKNEGQTEEGRAMEDRAIIREASLDEFRKNPDFANEGLLEEESKDVTLYPNWTEDPTKVGMHQWGMAIDLNSCVGCNACVVACVAENNIAVVGKEQVLAGRAMHWIRIDTYFSSNGSFGGDVANPRAFFQPIPCQQCENAPCEPVCPVGATVHSTEGLNDMVYNRCVGTRYCSNNCPYKVRRFNFLLFSDWDTQSLYPLRNPDVTVRSRGVMEKCTYCVQRINAAKIKAEKRDGQLDPNGKPYDGRVREEDNLQTACQQTCPTGAIVFGNVADPNSRVNKIKAQSRNYALLGELNTRPRTTYIAEVRNPNPQLQPKQTETHG